MIDIVISFDKEHNHFIEGFEYGYDTPAYISCYDFDSGMRWAVDMFGDQFSRVHTLEQWAANPTNKA